MKPVILSLLALTTASAASAATCESLASLHLDHTSITLAQPVAAGALTLPPARNAAQQASALAKLPAFCRVAATLTPTADSHINIEVWLPADAWNGKL